MTAASAFLASLQLADSALPIGRFVHSYGLERWLAENPQADGEGIRDLIAATLTSAVAPLDGAGAAHAVRASECDQLVELDRTIAAHKLTTGSRRASTSCGHQLAGLALPWLSTPAARGYLEVVLRGAAPGNLAVVEGCVAAALAIGEREAVLLQLRDAAAAMLAAAVRLGRLGPGEAQSIMFDLATTIEVAADVARSTNIDRLRSTSPMLEICGMIHRLADARIFVT